MFLNINTKLCTQCFFTTGHNKIGGLLRRVNGEITAKIHHWISTLKIGESIQRRQLALQCLNGAITSTDSWQQRYFSPVLNGSGVIMNVHEKMLMYLFCFSSSCSDKMFPAFGFGAQIPPTMQVILCVS